MTEWTQHKKTKFDHINAESSEQQKAFPHYDIRVPFCWKHFNMFTWSIDHHCDVMDHQWTDVLKGGRRKTDVFRTADMWTVYLHRNNQDQKQDFSYHSSSSSSTSIWRWEASCLASSRSPCASLRAFRWPRTWCVTLRSATADWTSRSFVSLRDRFSLARRFWNQIWQRKKEFKSMLNLGYILY